MSVLIPVDKVPGRVIATGLKFPEGPTLMKDGSIAIVEIERETVSRVDMNGHVSVIAKVPGGPNGLAVGPDGAFYVCNNGGFTWEERDGILHPTGQATSYATGSIDRVDPETGEVIRLYDRCGDHRLSGPNDIVFDSAGGFYFTDLGKTREKDRDHGGVFYARADGSSIVEIAFPVLTPNGIGLSPDEKILYVADMEPSRIIAFDIIEPGVVRKESFPSPYGGRCICGLPGYQGFDSLAVDAEGNIHVAATMTGEVIVIRPTGEVKRRVAFGDPFTTNICFGGNDLKTAFITLSGIGLLIAVDWEETGFRLPFEI